MAGPGKVIDLSLPFWVALFIGVSLLVNQSTEIGTLPAVIMGAGFGVAVWIARRWIK